MNNILSIDLESWVYIYDYALREQRFASNPSGLKKADDNYVPDATRYILDLLDTYNQKATFFVLGELYDWYPDTIEAIEERGHEIGYHSHTHRLIFNTEILEEELEKSRNFLKRFNPTGFRAPQLFITSDSIAALKKYGFKYSSSSYSDYKISNIDGIDEIPVSTFRYRGSCHNSRQFPQSLTLRMLSTQIPFGSGLFIPLLGSGISYFIDSLNRKDTPAVLFFHPWQLFRHKQTTGLGFKLKTLFRNPLCLPYTFGIEKTIVSLLHRHSFLSFRKYFEGKTY